MLRADGNSSEVENMADACFAYLTADPEELARFMQHTGLGADELRRAIGSESLFHGMIDYFAQNEPALLAMCANSGIPAERFMRVFQRLNGEG